MGDWTTRSYAVVDVEGNGQHPPSLVEAAIVPIDDGAIGPTASWLVRPPEPITGFARRIHGISNADVAGMPDAAAVTGEIRAALAGRVVVAHNAHVDVDVLTRELPGWAPASGVVDTLRLSRALLPDLPSHKLSLLVAQLGLAGSLPGLRSHRAGYDAVMCARLFVHLAGQPGGQQALATAVDKGNADDVLF